MFDINRLWWEAGATSVLAAQSGIVMFKDKKPATTPAPTLLWSSVSPGRSS